MTTLRLNLTHIAGFLALVESGGFGSAARQLGSSQAAVSHHLRRLEDCLAVPLIKRRRAAARRPMPQRVSCRQPAA